MRNLEIFKPRHLEAGDVIGVLAPSFFVEKHNQFQSGIDTLKQCGYKVELAESVTLRFENTTSQAKNRASEINRFFMDGQIKGIICADGGCCAIEVLENLDYETISKNPKIFSGFSDITHILLALFCKSHLPCIHGLDVVNGFGSNTAFSSTNVNSFLSLVGKQEDLISMPCGTNWDIVAEGAAQGYLVGGWLEAILNLSGSNFFSLEATDQVILFWETIDLEPSRIAMYLHALEKAAWFYKVKGILVGKLHNCIEKEYWDCAPTVKTVLERMAVRHNIPVVMDLPFGHADQLNSLPLGIKAFFCTDRHEIKLLESFTSA